MNPAIHRAGAPGARFDGVPGTHSAFTEEELR